MALRRGYVTDTVDIRLDELGSDAACRQIALRMWPDRESLTRQIIHYLRVLPGNAGREGLDQLIQKFACFIYQLMLDFFFKNLSKFPHGSAIYS